jgi:hypothetical protein
VGSGRLGFQSELCGKAPGRQVNHGILRGAVVLIARVSSFSSFLFGVQSFSIQVLSYIMIVGTFQSPIASPSLVKPPVMPSLSSICRQDPESDGEHQVGFIDEKSY